MNHICTHIYVVVIFIIVILTSLKIESGLRVIIDAVLEPPFFCCFAGITLDTKNFAVKTGVRTFEAAAYLRKRGANTLTVKGMFSDNIETYREKVDIVCKAHVYRGCAISIAPSGDGDIRLASAQAADEMLNLKGVDASFVLFEDNSQINISARSYGNVNVQIIMEKLGGGGHQTMAATQLKNTTKELAYQQLLSEIDNTLDDEENS